MRPGVGLAIVALLGANLPACARPAPAEAAARCLLGRGGGDGAAMAACSSAIAAGGMPDEVLALAYNARGEAHCLRSEFDLAIATRFGPSSFGPPSRGRSWTGAPATSARGR
ncbi:MAG TPA: hypothetical protein VFC47_15415 [Caulobacteraceae bacterium]|nr:hypothetical protein [Caulobacteraceae bacterium]